MVKENKNTSTEFQDIKLERKRSDEVSPNEELEDH